MEYNQSYISSKIRRAAQKFDIVGENKRSNDRLPPGQYLTQQFPILDLGVRPELAIKDFTLKLSGEIENPQILNYDLLMKLPSKGITKDFHCVTRWSRYDLEWKGVGFEEIVRLAKPKPMAKCVVFISRDDYTTNVSLEDCLKGDVIVAYELEGGPISPTHGGPVRMVVPHLYGWKSAKFLKGIRFVTEDEPGFWEVRGYNNRADPWLEERYS